MVVSQHLCGFRGCELQFVCLGLHSELFNHHVGWLLLSSLGFFEAGFVSLCHSAWSQTSFSVLLPPPLECWEFQVCGIVVPRLVRGRNKALEGVGEMAWGLSMSPWPDPNDPPHYLTLVNLGMYPRMQLRNKSAPTCVMLQT